jgi:hypothetical protein
MSSTCCRCVDSAVSALNGLLGLALVPLVISKFKLHRVASQRVLDRVSKPS